MVVFKQQVVRLPSLHFGRLYLYLLDARPIHPLSDLTGAIDFFTAGVLILFEGFLVNRLDEVMLEVVQVLTEALVCLIFLHRQILFLVVGVA